jgi:hypothetical protein
MSLLSSVLIGSQPASVSLSLTHRWLRHGSNVSPTSPVRCSKAGSEVPGLQHCVQSVAVVGRLETFDKPFEHLSFDAHTQRLCHLSRTHSSCLCLATSASGIVRHESTSEFLKSVVGASERRSDQSLGIVLDGFVSSKARRDDQQVNNGHHLCGITQCLQQRFREGKFLASQRELGVRQVPDPVSGIKVAIASIR